MKKSVLFATMLFLAINSFATTYMVSVGGMSFTPSTLTVHPGDVIMWMWADGTHTTTSTSVPSGATTWNSPITATAASFSYTPAVTGTYQYQCNIHAAMGMTGTITVVSPTGVTPVTPAPIFTMFPNPASEAIHLQFSQPLLPVSVILTDMNGKQVISRKYNAMIGTDLNLQNVPDGSYVIVAQQGGNEYKQQLVVAH